MPFPPLFVQIRDFVSEVKNELSKPGFNSFGLGDCKAPKVLGDIFESIAGAIFLDSGCDTAVVWKVSFKGLVIINLIIQLSCYWRMNSGRDVSSLDS